MLKKKQEIEISTEKIDTIIGKETVFIGKVVVNGTLRIEGKIEGEINGKGDVIIGETGRVKGNIKARHLLLAGEVEGNLDLSGKLELTSNAKLYGDIRVESLVIGEGARFIGNSTMISKGEGQSSKSEKAEKE
ncbi:MAG TPA: polymer-forming cytoskeletal protein [Clostridia bacterium]|nr:polymer-forming cytoskeletal protein [Clostridia bacterium]